MKTMKKLMITMTVCTLIISAPNLELNAQDIHFSQFWMTPLLLNPGGTGAFQGDLRAVTGYKDQWRSIANPYQTFFLSSDMHILKNKWDNSYLGVGLTVFNDVAGEMKMGTTSANLSVAGHVFMGNKNHLSVGLQGGFGQQRIDGTALTWGSQYDQSMTGYYNPDASLGETLSRENFTYGDFSAGILWNYGSSKNEVNQSKGVKFQAGVALHHVGQPAYSFYDLPDESLNMKIIAHANSSFSTANSNLKIEPSIIHVQQGVLSETLFGTMLRYQIKENSKYTGLSKGAAFSFGGHYRLQDAFIATVMLEYTSIAVGVSYDFNISALRTVSSGRGGIEFTLRFINPNPFQRSGSMQGPSFM
ncbi:MAG TPA: type IX secretion system membrane protein PorP/SprF [Flavobacteriales bacterium]|nr:type IX secretion system membrane protein PorP/SprF [Flavobacteriales bacterium]